MSDRIVVSRTLLTMGGLVLVSSLTVSAFLLGQATAPVPTVVVHAPAPEVSTGAPSQAIKRQADVAVVNAATPTRDASPVSTPAPLPSAPDPRPAVHAYFQTLDGEQGSIMDGLDAQALVQQALSGDTSGLDQLITKHKKRMSRIGQMAVPSPCEGHHAKLIALGRDGLTVMSRLRDGIASSDISSLTALQGDAARLQRSGEELNKLEAELKHKYGA